MSKIRNQKNNTLLAVDVGNTVIHFAFFRDGKLLRQDTSKTTQSAITVKRDFAAVLKQRPVGRVLICSVVPEVTRVLEGAVAKRLGLPAQVIGRDIIVPIKNLYDQPKQVGQDRLVCAFAARQLYGCPAIVIDLGTAITLDAVSEKGEYLGGIIVPGIQITTETLFERTALLPLVQFEKPKRLIGKNTRESILSGIYYGYGEMLKGLITQLSCQFKTPPKIVMTGGHAKLMAQHLPKVRHAIEPDLSLKGISLLAV